MSSQDSIGKILGIPTGIWVGIACLICSVVSWKLGIQEGKELKEERKEAIVRQWMEDHKLWEEDQQRIKNK